MLWVAVMLVAGMASADLSQDKRDCAEDLASLVPCLMYVSGDARKPTADCCLALSQVLKNNPKCVCILVKDSEDPNLGYTINATLASSLPAVCKLPSQYSIDKCIDILHLSSNSTQAAKFKGYGNSTAVTAPTPANATSPAPLPPKGAAQRASLSAIYFVVLLAIFSVFAA